MRGVIQVKTKGLQDDYFISSGPDSIHFFKQIYKKHVNFSVEPVKTVFNTAPVFGGKCSITLPNAGDLVNKMYLYVTLPPLVKTSGDFAGWTNSVGYAMIESIELTVNGLLVDKTTGLLMEIENELTKKRGEEDKLVGKYLHLPLLKTNAVTETKYIIPLNLWFNQQLSNSLPLISLYHSEVKITITFNTFDRCITYDGVTPPIPVNITEAYIVSDYIYLDDVERYQYKINSHAFLIQQNQYVLGESIGQSGVFISDLPFINPVYELLFVIREEESENNNDWFNYSRRNTIVNTKVHGMVKEAKLMLDNFERTDFLSEETLVTLNSSKYHTNTTDKHIYTMPFCDNPESYQPSGYINMSMFDTVRLVCNLKENIPASRAYIFAKNWNIVTISEGFLRVEWIA
jgi:hypothetical protein